MTTGTTPAPTFITTCYGQKYASFLAPLLHSIRAAYPDAGVRVLHADAPAREINLLAAVDDRTVFEPVQQPAAVTGGLHERIARKLHVWIEACTGLDDDHGPLCFIDADTLVLSRFDDELAGDWDVIYTWKDAVFPVNTGVMLFRTAGIARAVLTELARRVERTVGDKDALAKALGASGAADQHALRELIGFVNYSVQAVTVEIAGRPVRFRGVRCDRLNQTECAPITASTHVVHYKTGWHPILLDGAAFTANRPEDTCRQMFARWHAEDNAAAADIAASVLHRGAALALHRVEQIAAEYEKRGILHSEMLAACGAFDLLGCDLIIESGRCRGQSTSLLADYFAGRTVRAKPVRIVSIELTRDENAEFAEKRLAHRPNVELLYGDSLQLLPRLIADNPGATVGLLIDGPKSYTAIKLIERLTAAFPNVQVACLHDTRRGSDARTMLNEGNFRVAFTDDDAFVDRYRRLDEPCLPVAGEAITIHTWRPGMKGSDAIESYGPTLAVMLPRPTRIARFAPAAPAARAGAPAPAAPRESPDAVPNRYLTQSDWADPRYARLRDRFATVYRDELRGTPHPFGAKNPDQIVTHWSREWEYPWAVINARLAPGMAVADLGCGGSPLLPLLNREYGCAGYGVDLNLVTKDGTHNLRGFRTDPGTIIPNVRWLNRSMTDTGIPAQSLDRVFCISVLEHVDATTADQTFAEAARVLKPGGRLLITTDVDGSHRTMTLSPDDLIGLARNRGLTLDGETDFRRPSAMTPPRDVPGTYDVVGMVFKRAA
jgi:SAM-dependent methyltransferase